MRILFYYPGNLDLNRGTPNRARNIIKFLSKKEQTIFAAGKLTLTEILSLVNFYQLKKYAYFTGLNLYLKSKELKKIIEMTQPDIIYGFTNNSTFVLGSIARWTKAPIIIEMHDPDFKESRAATFWLNPLERMVLRNIAGIVTVSSKLKSYYLDFLKNKDLEVTTIRGGIDLNLFNPSISPSKDLIRIKGEGKFLVGYIGNFRYYQGINFLIETAKKIKDSNFVFVIIGGETEGEIEELKAKLKENNLQERFLVLGEKKYEEIPQYLKAIDVLVIPRPSLPITEYAFPSKLPEYMAMAKPVISTDVDGAREIIKDKENGILISPENIEDNLVKALLFLKENPSLREKIGQNAYKYVRENLSWDKLTDQLISFFQKVLSKYGRRF